MPKKSNTKIRGITLIETLLALSIGTVILASSVYAINQYNQGLKVMSAANLLNRLTNSARLYAADNHKQLLTNAPQTLPIEVLAPYFAGNIDTDAFRTQFHIATGTYTFQVPDDKGGTISKTALNLLIVGEHKTAGFIPYNDNVRTEVANNAGLGAGFVSTNLVSCLNNAGTSLLPAGNICGAHDAYSFSNSDFPTTNITKASYVSLISEGDASLHGDQLYRYDFGDPDLNTMHTDIHMSDNQMINVKKIHGANRITFEAPTGTDQKITTSSSPLSIETADNGSLTLAPGNGLVQILQHSSGHPIISPANNTLQLGDDNQLITIGDLQDDTINLNGAPNTEKIGSANLKTENIVGKSLKVHELNSLHNSKHDPLRLQNFHNGELVIGKRVKYTPTGSLASYELSDGKITARNISLQDIECADCGGSLANLLPRWRHVGTYFVSDQPASASGVIIPKPDCSNSRRSQLVRASTGEDASWDETSDDPRYETKIILVPQKFGLLSHNDSNPLPGDKLPGVANQNHYLGAKPQYSFYARDYSTTEWIAFPNVYNGISTNQTSADSIGDTSWKRDSMIPGAIGTPAWSSGPIRSPSNPYGFFVTPAPNDRFFYPKRLEHYSVATALALTYCHFTGGENPDPSQQLNGHYSDFENSSTGFVRIE